MLIRAYFGAALLAIALCAAASAADRPNASKHYKALKHSPDAASGTWAILDRDGANRQVPKYLSSLALGESGTGIVVSPSFRVAVDKITFSICGHDGPGGGQGKNYIALVDVRGGKMLRQTMAPGADPMQEQSWDVAKLHEREVRIEVHDGDAGGAYAWLGVGRIDAGPALRVDFRHGLPEGWLARSQPYEHRAEVLAGGVPFLRYLAEFSMIPASGVREIPCGFAAERLFVLGCTIAEGEPLETYGDIEIVYRQGQAERFPLMCGFTLDIAGKMLSPSKAMHLRPSNDPFQHYLVLGPRPEVIEKIVLRRNPERGVLPRITAITCQTRAESENLAPLPDWAPSGEESAWIGSHTITAASPDREAIMAEIRRAHQLP